MDTLAWVRDAPRSWWWKVDFKKRGFIRAVNDFSPKADVADVLDFVRAQKVPGELRIVLPGNGGISSIVFLEKEHTTEVVENGA